MTKPLANLDCLLISSSTHDGCMNNLPRTLPMPTEKSDDAGQLPIHDDAMSASVHLVTVDPPAPRHCRAYLCLDSHRTRPSICPPISADRFLSLPPSRALHTLPGASAVIWNVVLAGIRRHGAYEVTWTALGLSRASAYSSHPSNNAQLSWTLSALVSLLSLSFSRPSAVVFVPPSLMPSRFFPSQSLLQQLERRSSQTRMLLVE